VRILNVILSLSGGGTERQVAALAADLVRRGHDVHVAYVHSGVNLKRFEGSGCRLHHLVTSIKYDPLVVARSASLMRRLRPDVVQTWLAHMDIVGGAAARLLRVPWVMAERSAALSYPPTLLHRVRVAAGRRADRIVANSPGGAEYWTANGVDLSRLEVIPNSVKLWEIESAGPLDDARIGAGDELVLHVGRLSPEKNLGMLFNALPEVFSARPRAKLVLCGDGPLGERLAAQVSAAGLGGRVVFAGFVPNVGSWLKRASAVVSVSPCEGHPNAVLEAMAAAVPVVVSDIPAHRSMLDDDSAWFVANGARAIASGIIGALDARPRALQRAARARERVAALSPEATVTRYEDVYRRVVAERGTG
jgi:glycosyltransferase involved in cell wall biosynthesis